MFDYSQLTPCDELVTDDGADRQLHGLNEQRSIEGAYYLINVLLLDGVGRQETQHDFVGAIDDDSLLQQFLNDGLSAFGRIELHAEHEAETADVTDASMFGREHLQLSAEVLSDLLYV